MKSRVLVIGSANLDFVSRVEKLPEAGRTVITEENYSYVPGGKGANSAVTFARLGADVVFAAKLGSDANGSLLRKIYEKEGIDTRFVFESTDSATGLANIIVEEDGKNRIIVYPGANLDINEDEIEEAFTTYPDCVYLQFEIPRDKAVFAAEYAKKAGIPLFVDAGAIKSDFELEELKKVEIFSPNETECEQITGIYPDSLENCLRASIAMCRRVDIKYVVIKLGRRGAFVYDGKYYHLVAAHKVDAVDTTAAGDIFTASLTYAYLKKGDILEATRFANLAAGLSVTREGAYPSIPTLSEVKEFSKKIKELA